MSPIDYHQLLARLMQDIVLEFFPTFNNAIMLCWNSIKVNLIGEKLFTCPIIN